VGFPELRRESRGHHIAGAQNRTANTLDIYVIDVEGGNAVLFAAPSGESVFVDTGNGGEGAVRDYGRAARKRTAERLARERQAKAATRK